MKTIKHKYTGKSIKELYKQFGTGGSGFWSTDPWWKNEAFVSEKAEKGTYELVFDKDTVNKTYSEQVEGLKKGHDVPHAAIVIEAILTHYKETGERLLEDWYVRTSSLDSGGHRVHVGSFDSGGLDVDRWNDGHRDGGIGVADARKLALKTGVLEPLEDLPLDLESAIKIVKENGYQISKII